MRAARLPPAPASVLAALVLASGPLACGGEAAAPPVEAALLAATTAARPGEPLAVGIHLRMGPGWHVYWINPGDAGLAVRVRWTLPEGYEASPLEWPVPRRFGEPPVVMYGYAGEAMLLSEVRVPAGAAPGSRARIAATVEWLACADACIPGRATVELDIPIEAARPEPARPSADADRLAAARDRIPRADGGWRATIESSTAAAIALRIAAPPGVSLEGRALHLFAELEGVVDASRPHTATGSGGVTRLVLPRASTSKGPVGELAGVLVVAAEAGPPRSGPIAIRIEARPAPTPAPAPAEPGERP